MFKKTSYRIILIAILLANLIFLNFRYHQEIISLRQPLLQRLRPFLPEGLIPELVMENPLVIQTPAKDLFEAINAVRQKSNQKPYQSNQATCEVAKIMSQNQTGSQDNFLNNCANCESGALVTISNQAPAVRLISEIKNNQSQNDLILGQDYSHLCIEQNENTLTLFFATFQSQASPDTQLNKTTTGVIKSTVYTPAPTKNPKNFSELDLWQALMNYRHSHTRSDLERDENLCVYARKRVEEHIKMYASTPKEAYSRSDKYPLDAHAGFERDGNSGELFTITDRRVVAENLAYWPSAQYPHQVIEWGWDTSTEGHREAQLSEDYTHACIVGKEGFYVAIFGRS